MTQSSLYAFMRYYNAHTFVLLESREARGIKYPKDMKTRRLHEELLQDEDAYWVKHANSAPFVS